VGVVAGDRCAATFPQCDDPQSDVRECGDLPGCSADGDRSGPVQDHEGTIPAISIYIYSSVHPISARFVATLATHFSSAPPNLSESD